MRKAFAAADSDGSRSLGRVEFIVAAQKLQLDGELQAAFGPRLGGLMEQFAIADVDDSGDLTLDEYLSAMRRFLETEEGLVQRL